MPIKPIDLQVAVNSISDFSRQQNIMNTKIHIAQQQQEKLVHQTAEKSLTQVNKRENNQNAVIQEKLYKDKHNAKKKKNSRGKESDNRYEMQPERQGNIDIRL